VSTWILVWFIIAVLTTFALLALLIGLARQSLLLGRTARRAQDELQPMVSQISRDGQRASTKAGNLKPPARRGRS
jgi:hypothetical protein